MNNRVTFFVLAFLFSLCVILGIYFYPVLPANLASHWNVHGAVDGYMPKFWGVFIVPMLMLLISVFYFLIPRIDPLAKNIETFRKELNIFWVGLFVFFSYVFCLVIAWNLGVVFDFGYAIGIAIGFFFYFIGNILEKTKRNFFFGIRTPWALESDQVWEATQKLGGGLFRLTGVLLVGSFLFFSSLVSFILMLISIFLIILISSIYSYKLFKKIKNG